MHPSNRGPTIGLGVQYSYLHVRRQMHCGYGHRRSPARALERAVPSASNGGSLLARSKKNGISNEQRNQRQKTVSQSFYGTHPQNSTVPAKSLGCSLLVESRWAKVDYRKQWFGPFHDIGIHTRCLLVHFGTHTLHRVTMTIPKRDKET
jgi:hypothetical protein